MTLSTTNVTRHPTKRNHTLPGFTLPILYRSYCSSQPPLPTRAYVHNWADQSRVRAFGRCPTLPSTMKTRLLFFGLLAFKGSLLTHRLSPDLFLSLAPPSVRCGLVLRATRCLPALQMALGQLGILEELRERDTVSASHYVFDATGEIMGCKVEGGA